MQRIFLSLKDAKLVFFLQNHVRMRRVVTKRVIPLTSFASDASQNKMPREI
jgi:hypothetical protein